MSEKPDGTSQECQPKTNGSALPSETNNDSYKKQDDKGQSGSDPMSNENQRTQSSTEQSVELVASNVSIPSGGQDSSMENNNATTDKILPYNPIVSTDHDKRLSNNSSLKQQHSASPSQCQSNENEPALFISVFSSDPSKHAKCSMTNDESQAHHPEKGTRLSLTHSLQDIHAKNNPGDLIYPRNDETNPTNRRDSEYRRQTSCDVPRDPRSSPPHTPPSSPVTVSKQKPRLEASPKVHTSTIQKNDNEKHISNIDYAARPSRNDNSIVAYIPCLSSNDSVMQKIESIIMNHLYTEHKLQVVNVNCSSQLDVGIIYLANETDKYNLIQNIRSINISKTSVHIISFIDTLELVSYVVIDSKNVKNIPSENDITREWMKTYYKIRPVKCEKLSDEYPNIFRIILNRFDELIKMEQLTEFMIEQQRACVYFRADCCFLENLPATFNENQLKKSIAKQIDKQQISDKSIYIQFNKEEGNAIVLTCNEAREWGSFSFIRFDGQYLIKNDKLVYQIRLPNVPGSLSLSSVEKSETFANTEVKAIRCGNHIVVELLDKPTFIKCLKQRCLLIDGYSFRLEAYSPSANYEDWEINARNWYETQMSKHKSNIMEFIIEPEHPIFKFQWNSEAFLAQFNRLQTANDQHIATNLRDYIDNLTNQQRHLLRVTVMLNTIGILKKECYYVEHKEVKLRSNPLKTIVYNHQSKLRCATTIPLYNQTYSPKSTTLVTVINQDCLVAYEKFVSQGYHPLLLNMANAVSPGGGYRKGDGAQEENIFRRSNYYQSLDMDLDGGQRMDRYYCTSDCQLKQLVGNNRMYPMDEFGAIYTSGLTVFRHTENRGYELMERPLYDVCGLAIAAYRNPKLDSNDTNRLNMKYSIYMRKKIENMFAIAHHHKHDSLILSAFGCGAFRNPPQHVANIFKSVIEQYAGFFEHICFAIIDDHNTGLEFNLDGNFLPFKNVLHNLKVTPIRQETPDTMVGPWKIINKKNNEEISVNDIKIYNLPVCRYGARCRDLENKQHLREYQHPPLCPYANSSKGCEFENDSDHMLWFRHKVKFSQIDAADRLKNRNEDQRMGMNRKHSSNSRDIPMDIDDNRKSIIREVNKSLPICPFTPFHCRLYDSLSESKHIPSLTLNVRKHCDEFLHICPYGHQCHDKSSAHLENTIHVARHMCHFQDKCSKLNQEDHLNSFSHKDIADIRHLCMYSAYDCRDFRKPEHIIRYRHSGNFDKSSVIRYTGLNKDIDFVRNQQTILSRINDYASSLPMRTSVSVPNSIAQFVRKMTPVYQCSKLVFELILTYGYVMSDKSIEDLRMTKYLIQSITKHKEIESITNTYKNPLLIDHINKFIEAIVINEKTRGVKQNKMTETRERSIVYDEDLNSTIREEEKLLTETLGREHVDSIRRRTIDMLEASLNISLDPSSIRKNTNESINVDKCIRTILGPQLRPTDEDIVIVFKRKVMLHPDANYSIQPESAYFDNSVFRERPWIKDSSSRNDTLKHFRESKLHCSIFGHEYAAAAELMAIAGLKRRIIEKDSTTIIKCLTNIDSNIVFEGHLPDFIPLDYIGKVYIPKNIFRSLTPKAQATAKDMFRGGLCITDHEINLNPKTPSRESQVFQRNRLDYQKFVTDKLAEVTMENAKSLQELRGIVVTLPPSDFRQQIPLPLTITQIYDHYVKNQKQDFISNDIYIYWQAMYGDMMLTLSNESFDGIENQRNKQCLICYLAEMPSTTTNDYKESYSYLNIGDPSQHKDFITKRLFLTSSDTFHRGCNVDGFLVYCLKLERDIDRVTLSHAGPNSIYNDKTISYRFSKSDIKLNDLNFIHVSAGSQRVPIRNLMVCFQPIADQHPRLDPLFKPSSLSCSSDRAQSAVVPKSIDNDGPSNYSRPKQSVASSFDLGADRKARKPCQESINCLKLTSEDHRSRYSHPCRFAEVCRNQDKEPHLTHEQRKVEICPSGKLCKIIHDPYHRAKYRHIDLPDFLHPCREQQQCRNNTFEHRMRYSHGEKVELSVRDTEFERPRSAAKPLPQESYLGELNSPRHQQHHKPIPCRHGSHWHDQNEDRHCSVYSHPSTSEVKRSASNVDSRPRCASGFSCYNKDADHQARYSHA